MLLFAQATPTPTPQSVEVTLLDEGKAWWEDFVVPAVTLVAALVGGIGGVVIGGRMNRETMRTLEAERAEREALLESDRAKRADRQDAAHAEREERLDAARAERELAAERRLALGSLRLVMDAFEGAASNLEMERDSKGSDPLLAASIDTQLHVRPEDKHAIAIWVSDDIWRHISHILKRIELLNVRRAQTRHLADVGGQFDADDYRADAALAVTRIEEVLARLEPDLRRLEAP
jgi:hypothetical protein